MIAAARWVLLLAAVHRQSGVVIGLTIAAGLLAEVARKRWAPGRFV